MTRQDPRLLTAAALDQIAGEHWRGERDDVTALLDHIAALTAALRQIRLTYSLTSGCGPSLAKRLAEIAERAIGGEDD